MANSFRSRWRLLGAGLLAMLAGPVGAQSAAGYPNKPVRIIVPFAAGGSITPVMQMFSDRFRQELGQNFLLDYRPGGDTAVGMAAAAKAAPDGYTLVMNSSGYIVNHWLMPDLPYDTIKDFTPISTLTRSDLILVANPSVARSLKEFISYAKANPGKVNLSSGSAIGVLSYQSLMNVTGTKLTVVNYKGGPQPVSDVIAGHVNGTLTGVPNVEQFVKTGKLVGLAISGNRRNTALPDVPTFAEAGLKDYEAYNWWVLLAPAQTPRPIVEKMNAQVRSALDTPELLGALTKVGLYPNPATLAQADAFIRAEVERLGRLVKDSGLKNGDF